MSTAKYLINARRWFDRKNGNTYHSVKVVTIPDQKLIFSSGLTYGYGDQWQHTAYSGLVALGLAKEENRFNHVLNRERFIYVCSDVATQKELKGVF